MNRLDQDEVIRQLCKMVNECSLALDLEKETPCICHDNGWSVPAKVIADMWSRITLHHHFLEVLKECQKVLASTDEINNRSAEIRVFDVIHKIMERVEIGGRISGQSVFRSVETPTIKELCSQGVQNCHKCPDFKCGDNINPAKKEEK